MQGRDEPTHLTVCLTEPPRIKAASQPTEMSITVGTPLELTCVVTGVPVPTVTWEKDGRLLAGPWLVLGNESTLHIESTKVEASHSSSHLRFLFVPQFFSLLALCRWLMLVCTPAWLLVLLGRRAGASTSTSKVAWP